VRLQTLLASLLMVFGSISFAQSLNRRDATRGELLYRTHCIACHSTEVHWRTKKLVTGPANLQSEVRRWQLSSGLQWSDSDVLAVAGYLNEVYYHFSDFGGEGAGVGPVSRK
jgi:cytochrome c2